MEDRRVSFVSASRKREDGKRPPSPAPSEASRQSGSISGPGGKNKKATGKKSSKSPKGSFTAGPRRGSRKESLRSKEAKKTQEVAVAANNQARRESLFKKSDVRFKEIKRQMQKKQRDQKKQSDSGDKQRQEL